MNKPLFLPWVKVESQRHVSYFRPVDHLLPDTQPVCVSSPDSDEKSPYAIQCLHASSKIARKLFHGLKVWF